jgi:DNA-binding response OmpR family regulator
MAQESHGTVLLMDGNAAQRRRYSDILSVQGYAVYPAADLAEAEQFLAIDRPMLILLDVVLRDSDGFEACDRLRQRLGEGIPILFFAAADSPETVLTALRAGADDYVAKGGSPRILLERIAHWRNADRTDMTERRDKAIAYLETQIERAAVRARSECPG